MTSGSRLIFIIMLPLNLRVVTINRLVSVSTLRVRTVDRNMSIYLYSVGIESFFFCVSHELNDGCHCSLKSVSSETRLGLFIITASVVDEKITIPLCTFQSRKIKLLNFFFRE